MLKAVVLKAPPASTKFPHPADLHRTVRDRAPLEYQRDAAHLWRSPRLHVFGQPDPDAAQLWHVACRERERMSFMSLLPHDTPSRPLCS